MAQLAIVAFELEVRVFVIWIDLESLLEPLRGKVRLEKVLLVQRREVQQGVDLFALRRHHLELLLEDAHQLRPLLENAVNPREPTQALQVRRIGVDALPINICRPRRIAEIGLV